MSDILIRGMEMPKNESEILILAIKSNGSIFPVRIDGDGNPMIFQNEEMQNRAISVPEHGRLIDADELNVYDISPVYGFSVMGVTEEDIIQAPSIIPAEEDE